MNHTAFFDGYRAAFGKLTQRQVNGLELLLLNMDPSGPTWPPIASIPCMAYMLATVKHECADTWLPITERGTRAYFAKYDAGTPIGRRLGNTEPGDGYRFRGRGYVQITGRANYSRLSSVVSVDLVAAPDDALRASVAFRIMVAGMTTGLFTGKALADYIAADGTADYRNMRRIVNGTDQAARIAGYARVFQDVLAAAWLSEN